MHRPPRGGTAGLQKLHPGLQRVMFVVAAVLAAASPVTPLPIPSPSPSAPCRSDWDCSLNGVCSPLTSTCSCDAPWTAAPDCSSLSFLPAPASRGYPWPLSPAHNTTTWGGSVVQDNSTGTFHMFVAEMEGGCSLASWQTNSRCAHATSDTAEGPYVFVDVAVGHWCHNPAVVVEKQAQGLQLWALFHIGTGSGGDIKNCTQQQLQRSPSPSPPPSTLHTAPSPSGPWTPAPPLPPCNNPAPFIAPNGTVFLLCNGFTLYSCPSIAAAAAGSPWTLLIPNITPSRGSPPVAGSYEDPFLWIDPRGRFHVIYHVYRTGARGSDAHNCLPGHDGAVVAGHYFSEDGVTWGERVVCNCVWRVLNVCA